MRHRKYYRVLILVSLVNTKDAMMMTTMMTSAVYRVFAWAAIGVAGAVATGCYSSTRTTLWMTSTRRVGPVGRATMKSFRFDDEESPFRVRKGARFHFLWIVCDDD